MTEEWFSSSYKLQRLLIKSVISRVEVGNVLVILSHSVDQFSTSARRCSDEI